MTIGELERLAASKQRVAKAEAQERASYDYILANLIGRSVARIYSSSATMPDISTVYPSLFDSEEIQAQKAQKQAELSALRFRQFANAFNNRFEKRGANKSE